MKHWRVTIERANGTFYVRDVDAETSFGATSATLAEYRAKYADEPVDGFTHWIKSCVPVDRSRMITHYVGDSCAGGHREDVEGVPA